MGEGAFAGGSESGVVAVELLVVLRLFAVAVVRGAKGGVGTLVGAVREHEDLPGRAGLDDAVSAGRGQVVRAARGCAREPQRGAVRTRDDLDVHAVLPVFLGVVRLVRGDAVDGDERTVDDDEVSFARADEGFLQAGCPGGQNFEGLVHVLPGGCGGDPASRRELGQRLVLAQVHQRRQGLVEAARLAPPRAAFTPSGTDQP
ncbi:hypothetical protein GCM10010266_70630 [Streptomyces griseomycini]|nr:hypothetical protein GCM10010266_70630 [Streptomyces griseomycini]